MLEYLLNNFGKMKAFPLLITINSSGIIQNCFPEGKIPELVVGSNINTITHAQEIEYLVNEETAFYLSIGEQSYYVRSNPLPGNAGSVLVFENVINDMLGLILNNPYLAFVFIDKHGIIRLVNDALSKYSKVAKSDLIGRHISDVNIDYRLCKVLKSKKPDLLSILKKGIVVSRHPIVEGDNCLGVYAFYMSIDQQDVTNKHFGENYKGILESLEISSISQALSKLNHYMYEFYETNKAQKGIENIIGDSPFIQELKEKIITVANSPSSVLITGESGTGKGLVAEALHFHGSRSKYPFVTINCAAIPDSLLESELFGYADGAFTGARKGGKMGKFELANKGVIFLDEIGDMPLAMQAKLLRVIQERELERLGSENVLPVDVRIVSATNKDLLAMVKQGRFREDLYYRLNVINFHLSPLRKRKHDIAPFLYYTIRVLNKKLDKNIKGVSPEIMEKFMQYSWPGNFRELTNVLESAMNICRSNMLALHDLPQYFFPDLQEDSSDGNELQTALVDYKKPVIIAALEKSNGKRKDAAALLGISKSSLYRIMKQYDLF